MGNNFLDFLSKLDSLELAVDILANKPLPFEKAAKYLDVSESYLYKMTYQNLISFYQPGGKKIYFKIDDLNGWIYRNRVKSKEELRSEAIEIIHKQNKGML